MKGHSQLRKGRRSLANQIYHISTGTIAREPLLHRIDAGRQVVSAFRHEHDAGHVESLAFVVMPDHFHWLFSLNDSRSLSVCVNNVKSYSARNVNRLLGRQGPVWQTGYWDRAIRDEDGLKRVARYIVANPLRAGLVDTVREYSLWDAKWV